MFKIEDVKFKVAIGCSGRGGCIVGIVEAKTPEVNSDVEEYGSCLEDFFHEGSVPPSKEGMYLFVGSAYGIPGSDEMYSYVGEFKKLEI